MHSMCICIIYDREYKNIMLYCKVFVAVVKQ